MLTHIDPHQVRIEIRSRFEPERPPEGATPLSKREACRVRMQMRTTTRPAACRIGDQSNHDRFPDPDNTQ